MAPRRPGHVQLCGHTLALSTLFRLVLAIPGPNQKGADLWGGGGAASSQRLPFSGEEGLGAGLRATLPGGVALVVMEEQGHRAFGAQPVASGPTPC